MSSSNISFSIDASDLMNKSNAPKHLNQRMDNKLKREASAGSLSSPDLSMNTVEERKNRAVKQNLRVKQVSNKRSEFLDALRAVAPRISPEVIKGLSIDNLISTIQDPDLIQATSSFLLKVKKATKSLAQHRIKNPTKVFLSAFMIVYHTEEMMPEMDEQKMAVKNAAENMLKLLETLLDSKSLADVPAFGEAWHAYHVSFESWKSIDTEKLLNEMFEHYQVLEDMLGSVTGQEDLADLEFKPRIELQQKNIRAKIMRIGGKSALAKLMGNLQIRRQSEISSDGEVMSSSSPKPSHSRSNSVLDSPYEVKVQPLTEPETPIIEAPKLQEAFSEFGMGMSNEKLAHELIMDPEFQLTPQDNLQIRIATMAKKAFFDKVREDNSDPKMLWSGAVFADIRQQLLEMVPEKSKVYSEISEVLEPGHIEQQLKNGALDIVNTLRYVSSKMSQLCAPIRDADIRELEQMTDLPSALERILKILELMKMDLANFRLQQIRPHLMKQAVEYERAKFKAALDNGQIILEKTNAWLKASAELNKNTAAERNPQNIDIPENRVKFDAVYFDALLSLIFSHEPIGHETIPETLSMDIDRLFGFQNELQALTVVSALMMLTKNFVPEIRDDASALMKLKEELFVLLQDSDTTIDNLALHITSLVNGMLERRGKSLNEEQKSTIKTMVDKTLSYKDTVYLLLNRRIRDSIRQNLTTGKFRRDSNSGTEVVQGEVEAISRKIFIMAKHNRDVYAPWYDEIISANL